MYKLIWPRLQQYITHRVCGHDGLKGSGTMGVAALSQCAVTFTAR